MRVLFSAVICIAFFQISFCQLEVPTPIDGCKVIEHEYYSLCYNEAHEQASWVAYAISFEMLRGGAERKDNFRADPLVSTGGAELIDYKGSGYDRGHLAPAAVMKANTLSMSESFFMSNMSPQVPGFNRGVWKELEAWVRGRAMYVTQFDTVLYIVTGPVLTDDLKTIGPNKVSVPEYYFKAIYNPIDHNSTAGIGFLMKNEPSKLEPTSDVFRVSIDSIEVLTGIDFFPLLDDLRENQIEANNEILIYPTGGTTIIEVEPKEKEETVIRCQAVTGSGSQCKRNAESGKKYCWQHKK